jgi:hypothetical protein
MLKRLLAVQRVATRLIQKKKRGKREVKSRSRRWKTAVKMAVKMAVKTAVKTRLRCMGATCGEGKKLDHSIKCMVLICQLYSQLSWPLILYMKSVSQRRP